MISLACRIADEVRTHPTSQGVEPTHRRLQTVLDVVDRAHTAPNQRREIMDALDAGQTIRNVECVFRTKSGARHTMLLSIETIVLDGEPCLLGINNDITDLKKAESLREAQNLILEKIAQGAPLSDTLTELVSAVEAQAEGMLCSILLLSTDGRHLRNGAAPSLNGAGALNEQSFPTAHKAVVGRAIWEQSGVTPADLDVVQFYENFTGPVLIAMCEMGLAPPEGIEEFVSKGRLLAPHGALPLNTSGGNIGEAYIHGFECVVEAVRQVRGESTAQVKDVELSLAVAGPGFAPGSAVLFSN